MKTTPHDFFADRVQWETTQNVLAHTQAQLLQQGVQLNDLTCTNPTQCGFTYPSHWFDALNDSKVKAYQPDSLGLPQAREAVAQYYRSQHLSVSQDHVILTSSSSEAYCYLFRLLCNPYEEVLIPRPSYPLFHYLTQINDVQAVSYPLTYHDQTWRLDMEALAQAVTSRTKAILLVNPNNPTGSSIQENDYTLLIDFCHHHHLALICDEVFIDYRLQKQSHKMDSLVKENQVLTFVINGLSKTLALPQMKLSWIHVSGPTNLVSEAMSKLDILADTFLSVNTPVQLAMSSWLAERHLIQDQIRDRCNDNLTVLNQALKNRVLPVEAGWSAVVKFDHHNDEECCLELLRNHKVLIQPGYLFDFDPSGQWGVISLLTPKETLQQGLAYL